eukprot:SAG22_NODE_11162_length_497_cov_1.688442_2_plen_36_part_01
MGTASSGRLEQTGEAGLQGVPLPAELRLADLARGLL